MGMFDRLYVDCPRCGEFVEFQSKAGDCTLTSYYIHSVPSEIALDCKDDVEQCPSCLINVGLQVQSIVVINPIKMPV